MMCFEKIQFRSQDISHSLKLQVDNNNKEPLICLEKIRNKMNTIYFQCREDSYKLNKVTTEREQRQE